MKRSMKKNGPQDICMGGNIKSATEYVFSYENRDFSYKGELKNYNYNSLLKNKQDNIYKFMELAKYYVDADDIVSGIIKRVFVPFSMSSGYTLEGKDRVKKRYKELYQATGFEDVLRSIFFELYTFSNCYMYVMDNGHLITLPPQKIRIADIMVDGEPVLEFNIIELNNRRTTIADEKFIETLATKYKGYPKEIGDSIRNGKAAMWVQLNPKNTLVVQESKPMWEKYSIPFISTCLKPLAKKELISFYEDTLLNMGAKGFLHVKLGHDELLPTPNRDQINEVVGIFKKALNKYPLAVTNHMISANFISMEQEDLFDNSKYNEVNNQILSAGGISTVMVTGDSSNDSFASVNMSVETTGKRIQQNQANVAEAINKYNKIIGKREKIPQKSVPIFKFKPVNLSNSDTLKKEAFALWQQGNLSRRTLLEGHDYDYDQEKQRREKEQTDEDVFAVPQNSFTSTNDSGGNDSSTKNSGRPSKNPSELKRDKNQSETGKQPKPSNK